MNLQTVVQGFSTTPFLFVGSGFSRRYYNLPDWAGLLRVFANRLKDDAFAYSGYVSEARIGLKSEDDLLPRVASLIMRDFDKRWFSDQSFRKLTDKYLPFVQQEQSPFKAELAQYIEENSSVVADKADELRLFRSITSRSLSGIITTNYDLLLENETDEYSAYVGQEELVFSAIQGWAEIYKIHGSITKPDSIVITEQDYQEFADKCAYLASKLMTIFMEYPIVFMGYSLNDSNIRTILQAIVNCLSDENLERLQNRFVYVEWVANKSDVEITAASITVNDKIIRMTSIKTDNFSAIYNALQQKHATLPAKVLRLFKQEFYTYALTNQPTANIRVADIDDARVGGEELVLAIGKPSRFNLRGLQGLTAGEWFQNIVMHDIEFSADEILEKAYPNLIAQSNKLPLNMLLKEAKKEHPDCERRVIRSFDATLNTSIRKTRDRRKFRDRSVAGIITEYASDRNKIFDNIAHLYEQEIDCGQLEEYLRKCFSEPGFYEGLSSTTGERSNFNRLVRIFDYLKYGK